MRYIKPKYCPRLKSKDMPLKKAHKKCPFRTRHHDKVACICPSAVRYMKEELHFKNCFGVNLLCLAEFDDTFMKGMKVEMKGWKHEFKRRGVVRAVGRQAGMTHMVSVKWTEFNLEVIAESDFPPKGYTYTSWEFKKNLKVVP
jgi:hypothetical protein